MKHEAEIRNLLINNTINVIAEGGFEKATVKEITTYGGDLPNVKMNDVYIYRIFGSKEALYDVAFFQLDEELFQSFSEAYRAAYEGSEQLSLKERIFKFLDKTWSFIMRNENRCRCYVRYYYSIYFDKESADRHMASFNQVISKLAPAFKEEADVSAILHTAFTTILHFAIRAYNKEIPNDEDSRYHIFNVVYNIMSAYFKAEK
jgi:AcrR family transcriptional regulator